MKAVSLLLILLAVLKPLQADVAFVCAFLFQLYVPGWLGYHFEYWPSNWKSDLKRTAWFSLLTLSLFASCYHVVQNYWASTYGLVAYFEPNLELGLLLSFAVNFLLIAWPEEVFYRGFLQSAWRPYGLLGIIGLNALFALGHFVGEYDPARLLPFFPGIAFSWLTYKAGGSLLGAVTYHSLCNVLAEFLAHSYRWRS